MNTALDHLVDELRSMVGDPAGADQTFDRDEIEDVLLQHRQYTAFPLETEDGFVWGVPLRWWSDVEVTGSSGVLTPDEEDLLMGTWTFAGDEAYADIAGFTYDLNAAAADLCLRWVARVSRKTDFSTPGLSVSRSQQATALRELAAQFRKQIRAGSVVVHAP